MDKEIFRLRLEQATRALIEVTAERSTIPLADITNYVIVPNSRVPEDHLNHLEVTRLSIINRYEGKELSKEQAVDLLWNNGNVPLWINMSVYYVQSGITTIELFCSRRFRPDEDLNNKVSPYPPFSIGIAIPPDISELKENQKFDINWRKQFAQKKTNRLLAFVRKLFTSE